MTGTRRAILTQIRPAQPTRGDLRQLEQHANLRVGYFGPSWEITEAEVAARTHVSSRLPRFERAKESVGIDGIHANQVSSPFRLFEHTEKNPVRLGQGSDVAAGARIRL